MGMYDRVLPLNQSYGGRRFVLEPEYRALEQIVADAESAGVPVFALGPAGIIEIQPTPCRPEAGSPGV